jgi:HAMP domain-containing protein
LIVKIIWKFNIVLVGICLFGFVVAAFVAHSVLQANAKDEILRTARLMMEAAGATRDYTNVQIKPLLETQLKYTFLPQTVPAFAATEQFNELRKKHADFIYKEATLNPTNPRDRASDWEADIINQFRASPGTSESYGERDTPTGRTLFLARPLQVKSQACLECHSTVEAAPKTMLDLYGNANGFGWKMNEIIGMQVVSVPTVVPVARANQAFRTLMLMLAAVFLMMIVLLNVMLYSIVVKRVTRLSKIADQVSLGNMEAGEFRSRSKDEIGVLTDALGRMKTSLVQAMNMLEGK